ncbi:alpha/beta-hydrolase [Polyplosphaeria fusca]|uniref:Alpha/beta-hydrolase n=1 Tax=Polyplosphaeria fusca TaxID=682080 RepID=A0A9P4QKJ1_9PLEO|nr:alpha/beta-hydrolase [Polyplosphaeria fusca]
MSPTSTLWSRILGAVGSSAATGHIGTSALRDEEAPAQRFRTDNDSSDTFTLPDGRKIGYAQYGSLTGRPILYMHGFPGSRLEAAGFDRVGQEVGARIIAVDRPGVGWSSPHAGRTLLDLPKDVERLARHLGLESYSVLGISGGGPYVLACAAALPREKLKCASIVVGLGPPDIGMSGADWLHRLGFPHGLRYAPFSIVKRFWQSDPSGRLDLGEDERLKLVLQSPVRHEKDAAFMKSDWPRLSLRAVGECYTQGFDGIFQDGRLICSDFGFQVEDIRSDLPLHLWYGKLDTFVPSNHGVQIAARWRGKVQLKVEDETHASIVVNRSREILAALTEQT